MQTLFLYKLSMCDQLSFNEMTIFINIAPFCYEILCVEKIRSRPRGILCVDTIGSPDREILCADKIGSPGFRTTPVGANVGANP